MINKFKEGSIFMKKYEITFKQFEDIFTFTYDTHERFLENLHLLKGTDSIEVLEVRMNGKDITYLV